MLGHAHDHWAAFFLIEFFSADGTLEPIIFLVHVKDINIYILAGFLGIGLFKNKSSYKVRFKR